MASVLSVINDAPPLRATTKLHAVLAEFVASSLTSHSRGNAFMTGSPSDNFIAAAANLGQMLFGPKSA